MSPLNFVRRITSSSFVASLTGKSTKGVCEGYVIAGLVVILIFQASPSLRTAVCYAANPFQWSILGWMGFNLIAIVALLGFRYGKGQIERIAVHRARCREERAESIERKRRAENRERVRQLQEARMRRRY
jgi:hypothetical protein